MPEWFLKKTWINSKNQFYIGESDPSRLHAFPEHQWESSSYWSSGIETDHGKWSHLCQIIATCSWHGSILSVYSFYLCISSTSCSFCSISVVRLNSLIQKNPDEFGVWHLERATSWLNVFLIPRFAYPYLFGSRKTFCQHSLRLRIRCAAKSAFRCLPKYNTCSY